MTENNRSKIMGYIDGIRDRIVAVLPPEKPAGNFLANVAEYLIRNQSLFQCERFSLETSIIDAAMLGLELGPPFDLAEIIPYKDREGRRFANLVIEYRGHMSQVYKGGRIKSIEARPVYKHDAFEYNFGRRPALSHQPTILGDRGPLIYAYAIAQLTDGGTAMEVITQHDAAKARADSPGAEKPGSLWKTRTAEMWTKTAIKKLVNRLPRAPARGDPTDESNEGPTSADYEKLIKAICVSPDLYKQATVALEIDFPSDIVSINAVLATMRDLYRSKDPQDPPVNGEAGDMT